MKKKTNVPGSDLDAKIKVNRTATIDQRHQFQEEMGSKFPLTHGAKVDVVHARFGDIDVLPNKADYFPDSFKFDKLGVEPFKTNPVGRDAVRNIKHDCNKIGWKVSGKKIEDTVLRCQQLNKGINRLDLMQRVKAQLRIPSGWQD